MARLTDEQKIKVVEWYKKGMSGGEISKIVGIRSSNVIGILKRRNVKIKPRGDYRRYKFDDSIFDKIDSEEKAYWLGFITADGSVNRYVLSVEIGEKDAIHLKKLKKFFRANVLIKKTRKKCCIIRFNSVKLIASLAKWNVVENKTLITRTPNIDKRLLSHYYRGVFDGDGWFTQRKMRNKNSFCKTGRLTYDIGFSSGSSKFIEEIHKWVIENVSRKCGSLIFRTRKNQSVFQLTFGGNNIVIAVGKLLYDGDSVCLDRKLHKWKSILSYLQPSILCYNETIC